MKKVFREDFRLEVYPLNPGHFGSFSISGIRRTEDEEFALCESIKRQIRKHVDGIGGVYIVYDTVEQCEFCNSVWEKAWDTEGPICCDKALEEYEGGKK